MGSEWKKNFKNSLYIWGFLVLFVLFDLFLDLWTYTNQNGFLALSLILLICSFMVAIKAVRKMTSYDMIKETLLPMARDEIKRDEKKKSEGK